MNSKTKMSKRILSTILSFLILLSIMPIIPITASAADDYLIYTANDLMNFAKQVNSGSKSTNGKLMANINMAGKVWEPILDYAGTFNGQGYSISNLTMTIKGEGCFGMFGKVNGATIKDFSLTGSVTSNRTANSNFNYGSIIGWSDGNTTLLRVHSAVNFTSYDNTYKDKVGGLIGHVQSSILNVDCCSYSGTLNVGDSDIDCMGGIVAYVNANKAAVITHCKFTGKIQSTYTGTNAGDNSFVGDQIGGFVGYYRGVNLYIQSCLSVGTISVASGYSALSGHFMGILRQHNSANSKITNNYYLTGNPFGNNPNITDEITDGMGGQTVAGSATKTTNAQLKSGEIAYKLGSAWGQKIGTDSSPVIGGNKVYYGYTSCSDNATKVYTNTSTTITKPAHSWLNGTCSGCKKSCQHSWSNSTCTICEQVCQHNWSNGVCSVCKKVCEHNWDNGTCSVCKEACDHNWKNSTCTICKQACQHNWDNGTCSVCKEVCDHNWKNSTCTICSKVCNEHNWDNGNCLICDKICEHSWSNGICSVCKKVCEHTYENGFCKECDSYQPATLTTDKYDVTGDGVKDTVYEISNGGQFYWFSAVTYNGYGDTEKDSSANAVLTNDIWVNKDVIVNGALNPNSETVAKFRSLTKNSIHFGAVYDGVFDGQNHTISGLYFTDKDDYAPSLFHVLSKNALVKNVGVVDSYFWTHEGRNGMISYTNYGTIDNCWSDCIVFNSGVTGAMAGENYGVVRNCRNYSVFNISDSGKYGNYGGIVGINCGGLVENCINYGTINARYRVGGIVGYNEGIIRNCYNIGTVGIAENTGNARGGISGGASYYQNSCIENCYNIGKVVGGKYFVGGIVGEFSDTAIIQNCYYLEGCAIDGSNVIQNGTGIMAIGITKADEAGITISSTAQQFASGEVAYLLGDNFGQDVDNGKDVQKYPTFTGAKVYQIINCKNETAYSNTNENNVHKWTKATCTTAKSCSVCNLTEGEPLGHKWFYGKCDICGENCLHTYENGFCSECDRYEPATLTTDKYDLDNDGEKDEVYEISNAGQLYWFADAVNYEGYDYHGANAVLTENINVNAGYTFSADGTVTKDGKTVTTGFRSWDGIGNNYMYSGIFDGQNHTISGLYCDVGYRIGLFGMICDATIKNVGIVDSYLRSSEYVGSVVGYSLRGIVTNCYNTSIIIGGNKTGGIVGYGDSGIITDCYNTGTIISESEKTGGIVGDNTNGFVTNCYYLDTCGATGAGTLQTAQQFASGEVAYLLGSAFGQKIGKDNIPVLGGDKVYQVTNCKNETAYSNTNEPLDHNWLEATCTTPKCCSVCNNIIGEKLGHSYDNDCDADCNRCGDTRVPAQHRYLYNCDTNCDECGALTRPDAVHKIISLYTCCESTCMYGCGTILPPSTDHIYDNNCDTACNNCGTIREGAGHTEEIIPGYKATCTASGLTDGKKCSVCGITILTQQPISPLGGNHNYENGACTICGDKEPQITPPTEPTIKTDGYYVIGDINLKLTACGTNKLSGTMALQPGTYNIKLNNYGTLLGYKKTITDSSNGMTFKASYSSYVTLNATGGTYTFQVDVITNALVIKYNSKLPKQYLIGDINTILSPVEGKTLAIGTTYLEAGTYQFKLSIDAVEFGYKKTINDSTAGASLSFNSKYGAYVTLIATGGNYTFTLNTSTNKLIVKHSPVKDEAINDVHVSGDINFVLDDDNGNSNIATATVKLNEDTYSFKVYNYGNAVTNGVKITDEGTKTLYGNYSTPLTLVASGGTYTFSFNKTTNEITIEKWTEFIPI